MRGSSFLSLRAYGKYGSTAVTRRADECLSASSRIEQLDDVLRQRRAGGLHHEHVLLAHVLVDLDLEVLVREARRVRAPERDAELAADLARQLRDATTPEKTLSPSAIAPSLRATMIA